MSSLIRVDVVRDNFYAYGRTRGFLTTHARLVEGGKGLAVPQGLDLYCHDFCGCSKDSSPCEHYQLFLGFLERGAAQAEQVYTQKNVDLVEDLGRAAGFTSRRPPRHYPWVSAWRDGAEAKLHGEVFRRFDVTLFELIFMGEVGVVFAQKRARLFPLLLYHLLSTRTLPFWAIFLAFFPLYSGGSDARLSHPR